MYSCIRKEKRLRVFLIVFLFKINVKIFLIFGMKNFSVDIRVTPPYVIL